MKQISCILYCLCTCVYLCECKRKHWLCVCEQCHKNAKRTAVVAKCFAKGKFVLLDSVLTSIHNKNLLSIKQKTMILKLSLNWSYQTLITTEIDLPVAFVFGSFNHKYIIQVAFHANFADQAQKNWNPALILSICQLPKGSLYLFNFYLTSMWKTQRTIPMSIMKQVMQFLTFYAIWQQ